MTQNSFYKTKSFNFYITKTYFRFSFLYILIGGKHNFFTSQFEVQLAKSTLIILFTREKCQLWQEKNTFPSISSFIDRVFSIFRQKNVRV